MNTEVTQGTAVAPSTEGPAKIVYFLYLVSVIIGFTGIIGVIVAYIYKNDAPDWLKNHYRFQIRTFWIGLLYLFIGGLLSTILIGFLVLLFWVVWLIVRCVKGLQALGKKEAPPNVEGWLF